MIAANKRHSRGKIDCFGDSVEAAKDGELPEPVGENGGGGDEEPEDEPSENEPFTREAVAKPAGDGAK